MSNVILLSCPADIYQCRLFRSTFYVPPALFQVFLEAFEVASALDIPDVSEPQASGDIPAVFVLLRPACVFVSEVNIPERPKLFVLPRICSFASPSSSFEGAHKGFADSSTGARTNCGFCSNLSSAGLR